MYVCLFDRYETLISVSQTKGLESVKLYLAGMDIDQCIAYIIVAVMTRFGVIINIDELRGL